MVSSIGISNINPLQMLNAVNAFKSAQSPEQMQAQKALMPEISGGTDINDTNILQNQNLDEIKQIAKTVGEENISEDDIKYGITYGRSVIADYSA